MARISRALNRLYSGVLPGPLRFLPTFLIPLSVLLAAVGASYGTAAWLALTGYVTAVSTRVTFLQAVTPVLRYDLWNLLVPVVLSLSGGIFCFILMPVLDVVLGDEEVDNSAAVPKAIQSPQAYRSVLYAYTGFHFLLLLSACFLVAHHPLSPLAFLGLVLSMGCEGGLVFTAAHELLHSRQALDRNLADALLASMFYMHWSQSHLAHHQKVATWEDPASARLNESFYAFLPRTVAGNLADGLDMEAQRLRQHGQPWYSLHNRVVMWVLCPLALCAAIHLLFGGAGLALFLGQAVAGVLLLELINYIEHYGLTRRRLPGGRYERVSAAHSWNANSLFTNSIIFRLQRHTDHHMQPNKPFHRLQDCPGAPQLPWSYPTMASLALLPPLFFRIMNPRVQQQQQQAQPVSMTAEAASSAS